MECNPSVSITKQQHQSIKENDHVKTLLTGKTKHAVNGMGYSGAMYNPADIILQRLFGQRPHFVSLQAFGTFKKIELIT